MDPKKELKKLEETIKVCRKCTLCDNRLQAVPGEGNPNAEIVLVGEAPGKSENEQGRPFVGAAGQFLNQLLSSVGWQREDVFITNIVKDQPPGNRDPLPDEIKTCTETYLISQLDIIKPKVIVPLGRHAMNYFLPGIGSISQVHGRAFRRANGRVYLPLYHPAVALYQEELKPILIKDFQKLPKLLQQLQKNN